MAYMKSSRVSRPVESSFGGVMEALGFDYQAATNIGAAGVGAVVNYFGQKSAASIASSNARAEEARAAAAQASRGGGGGIPTTYLIVGGLALAGVLVFAMRGRGPRKNPGAYGGYAYLSPPDARNRPIAVRKRRR